MTGWHTFIFSNTVLSGARFLIFALLTGACGTYGGNPNRTEKPEEISAEKQSNERSPQPDGRADNGPGPESGVMAPDESAGSLEICSVSVTVQEKRPSDVTSFAVSWGPALEDQSELWGLEVRAPGTAEGGGQHPFVALAEAVPIPGDWSLRVTAGSSILCAGNFTLSAESLPNDALVTLEILNF